MKIDFSTKVVWASLKITLVCFIAAEFLTYVTLRIISVFSGDFTSTLGESLLVAAVVVVLVCLPVSNVVLQQAKSLESANDKLRNLIRFDQLTGMLSRSAFFKEVTEIQAQDLTNERFDAVFFMDLDHFKKINDQYGHSAGDEVLRQFGALVLDELQKGELACRLGGEEFALFMPDCNPNAALGRAERLIGLFAKQTIMVGQVEISCTMSIGTFSTRKRMALDAMLNRADVLLYQAKQAGRNRVVSRETSRLAA